VEPADLPSQPSAAVPPPETTIHLPQPTIWPFIVGLGITTALAGVILSPAIVAIGGVVLALGLAGWIAELRHAAD